MNYEQIIQVIEQECRRRGISAYKLAQMSEIPISTIYGILHQQNKAQLDTLCAILRALNLELVLVQRNSAPCNNDVNIQKIESDALLEELPGEKKELICKLIEWLIV